MGSLFQGVSWSLFIHLPGVLADLGASEAEIGVLFGVSAIAAILVRPPVGHALDHYGRKPLILSLIHI